MVVAEILLVLAGHSSSLFTSTGEIAPAWIDLLHPGEIASLQSLSQIARRYNHIKHARRTLCPNNSGQVSKFLSALLSTLNDILKHDYEDLVVQTEAKVVKRDDAFVASGSYVPLASIRATFAEFDAPFAAIQALLDRLSKSADGTPPLRGEPPNWPAGKLIDILLDRADEFGEFELTAFLVHGTLSPTDPLADEKQSYALYPDAIPSCVSFQTRESITYVGKALVTVRIAATTHSAKHEQQLPRQLMTAHTKLLEGALPQDRYAFDSAIATIRTNVSEWLWSNVLTRPMVNEALDSLAHYFLLRNGEFGLSLIREIERLKVSRLTARHSSRSAGVIREQDLQLALLRASLGTSAQHDPTLTRLRMTLPSGPLRPLLPSLSNPNISAIKPSQVSFADVLLGTPLVLIYTLEWPLDLFLQPSDLQIYADLFAYLSSLRKVHTKVLECWGWLSNSQRARRKWTGLGEGGTEADEEGRRVLLRCGWGVVRDMLWFLDTLLAYIMMDVVDVEFRELKERLHLSTISGNEGQARTRRNSGDTGAKAGSKSNPPLANSQSLRQPKRKAVEGTETPNPPDLDFTTLREVHNRFLERVVSASLLANASCATTIRTILEVCERFVAQVERWDSDVLPGLLDEGSVSFAGGDDNVGGLVRERWRVVHDVNEALVSLFETFYEQLTAASTTQVQANMTAEMTLNNISSMIHPSMFLAADRKKREREGDVRRHIERLLLRLDFNGALSKWKADIEAAFEGGILKGAGL
ncbi:Spindle pole body component {ECO:0000256/RuleBase:RU363050} [Serendipita indica DSM 11827]|nr:Spindle pole body component {ECO:0000256/RuleBase:RU363050} [Serendipita indica DSM 11827]